MESTPVTNGKVVITDPVVAGEYPVIAKRFDNSVNWSELQLWFKNNISFIYPLNPVYPELR